MLVKGVIADQTGFCGWMMGDILYYQRHTHSARCTRCRPINNDILHHSKPTHLASESLRCIFRPLWHGSRRMNIYISHRPSAASTFIILSMAKEQIWTIEWHGWSPLLVIQYIDACHRVGTLGLLRVYKRTMKVSWDLHVHGGSSHFCHGGRVKDEKERTAIWSSGENDWEQDPWSKNV